MNVFVVYCHNSRDSFTYQVYESFLKGLLVGGHSYEVSDLYAMHFNPVMSELEYRREAYYDIEAPIPVDVAMEHAKIDAADVIVFIYPDYWTASPAMLEGWFQRVWTYGYAYGPNPTMPVLQKAIFMVTMGGSLQDEIRRVQLEAMKTVMIGDRFHNRAHSFDVYAFDEMTRGYGNDDNREARIRKFIKEAYEIGRNLQK